MSSSDLLNDSGSTSAPTQSVRLSVPYSMYLQNPTRALKQLLGHNITILSYEANDIITDDDHIIVDVKYTSIPFSLLKIYYVEVSSLKHLMPNSEKYVAVINGCNVKINAPKLKEFNKVLPIKVKATLSNNYSSSGQLDSQFAYYGTTVSSPMNFLCTPLKYINHAFEPFETETIKPIYTPEFKQSVDKVIKEKLSALIENTVKYYKQALSTFNILSTVDHVISASTFEECKMGTTAYIIPFDIIPLNKTLNGIILIQPKRIPNYVLFFPTHNFSICEEELVSIKNFLIQDENNYYNFRYVKEVLNSPSSESEQ